MNLTEDAWEQLALETLGELGWAPTLGAAIAPGGATASGTVERESWDELLIRGRLRAALVRLNPDVPREFLDQALDVIVSPSSQDAIAENYRMHTALVDGFRGVTYIDHTGTEQTPTIRLVSTAPHENDWLAVNQVTIVSGEHTRRFDVVLYLNGMPVAVIELKNAGSAHADVASAHAQLQTYLREFPLAFRFAVLTLASDGITAKYGTPFTPLNHFSPWNITEGGDPLPTGGTASGSGDVEGDDGYGVPSTPLDHALYGLFNQERFTQLLMSYVAFDQNAGGLAKRIAKPHQYFAVSKAVAKTVLAVESNGKAGVVWHTQGSGKSMEMELYANLVIRHPKLRNPTIVVITDRNELDGQLYETFAQSLLLPEAPQQIRRREELRSELSERTTGGIYFTTLQKFGLSKAERDAGAAHPVLSDRRNIVVVVDEAHRSHYDNLDGYAWHLKTALPHATLIAFTGTPISFDDRNTRDVFGDYIDVYDLSRAVDDGATVPVYFESRLIKVHLADGLTEEDIDRAADEATEGLDDTERDRIQQTVAVVNAVYGAPARIAELAADLVTHWEARRAAMFESLGTASRPGTPGKAMIVGATREICANLYSAIVALRPDWHSDDLTAGRIKVVYSGTAGDAPPVADHVRRDSQNALVKARLKDVNDELELVIVKDMMLTGFDAPPLHTLYLDRPIKGALLMQTLARVNRTFRGKQDGLLVAYAPVADNLARALEEYVSSGSSAPGAKPQGRNIEEAVALAQTLVSSLRTMLEPTSWRARLARPGPRSYISAVTAAVNYLRDPATPGNQGLPAEESLTARFRQLSGQLGRAWALCGRAPTLEPFADDARFFEEVRVWMAKFDAEERQARGEPVPDDVQRTLNQLMATAVVSGEVLDIYDAAGMPKPSLSDINTDFINKTQAAANPHLAIEALRKLIMSETRAVTRHNVVRQRAFSQRLQDLMIKYTNQQLTSAEVIAALIEVAKEVAVEADRGAAFSPPLDSDQLAFYDAVATNESAVAEQGSGVLADIARDLVAVMRADIRTDWTVRDDVKAKLRSSIKRLLVRHGYPPDQQPEAIKLVMEQMESIAPRFALATTY
ncbi:type I restriction enzyme, R subunit [Sanguibacter gelidistatuariae]|uniref:Type I restriction enzyme endonuclease subunit n=1 Tax=Sanguibacter gelidistatuariae TaxID=1814289 RepID=A0A1G6L9E2_9MICO|nr:type I restriction endonuclease subunit R [Sanguibacter gelidistatuariae]SDC39166.1 type I restriction enzyme, R subunit [Sanguibacter gelidistatuariae]